MKIITDLINADVESITDARLKAGGARNIADELRATARKRGISKSGKAALLAKAARLDAIATDIDDWADAEVAA